MKYSRVKQSIVAGAFIVGCGDEVSCYLLSWNITSNQNWPYELIPKMHHMVKCDIISMSYIRHDSDYSPNIFQIRKRLRRHCLHVTSAGRRDGVLDEC